MQMITRNNDTVAVIMIMKIIFIMVLTCLVLSDDDKAFL